MRGSGVPENPDVLYDSITAVDPSQETLVGLQQKLLFMMNLLQAADARPTTQAVEAVKKLTAMVPALGIRWGRNAIVKVVPASVRCDRSDHDDGRCRDRDSS